jgi:hypothetical protein
MEMREDTLPTVSEWLRGSLIPSLHLLGSGQGINLILGASVLAICNLRASRAVKTLPDMLAVDTSRGVLVQTHDLQTQK